jgi:hypothetical protein
MTSRPYFGDQGCIAMSGYGKKGFDGIPTVLGGFARRGLGRKGKKKPKRCGKFAKS